MTQPKYDATAKSMATLIPRPDMSLSYDCHCERCGKAITYRGVTAWKHPTCHGCYTAAYERGNTTEDAVERFADRMERCGIPRRFQQWDKDAGNNDLLQMVRRFSMGSIWIYGPSGKGKTRSMCRIACAEAWRAQEISVKMITCSGWTRAVCLQMGSSGREAESMIEAAKRAEILIMDDFMQEVPTGRAQEILFDIIDHRYKIKARTWLTTQYAPDQIADKIGAERSGAIRRRIIEEGQLIGVTKEGVNIG